LVLREEEGDKGSIKTSLNNIGMVFYNLKDFDKAIQNYLKASEISKEINEYSGLDAIYLNLGLSFNQIGKFDEAIKYFDEAFKLCGDKCNDNILKAGFEGLGFAYAANHQNEIAEAHFKKSLEIARKQNDVRFISENLLALGKIEFERENESTGLHFLEEAKMFAEAASLAEVKISIYKELADHYGNKKDYRKSLEYQTRYTKFKDSVYSEQLIRNLAKVQTNYAERENLKTIAAKDQILVYKEDLIQRQRRQYFFIVVITCLVISLAGVLFYFSKRQQKVNRELSEAKNKIEEQNLQLSGYNKELEIKVSERTKDLNLTNESLKRVNKELDNFIYKTSHDIRGPLATLKGMCNLAMVDVKDDIALNYLKKMDYTVDRLNTILTRLTIVNYINNSVLAPTAIVFRDIIAEIINLEKKKGMPDRFSINFSIEPGSLLISDRDLIKLILENLIDNAVKFHNDSERLDPYVTINVNKEDQFIKISVEDNGIGILNKTEDEIFQMFVRASERSENGGVGLYLAKLATEKIGGLISLEHSSEKGSLFQILLPEDINIILDPKSSQGGKIHQKIIDLRLKKKNYPAVTDM
jgi:signal transduction histidine kinase